MDGFWREHSWPVLCSVLLHAGLAAALVLMTMNFATRSPTIVPPAATINAVVVDSQVLHAAQRAQIERAAEEAQRARAAADAQAASHAAAEQQAADAAKAAAAAKAADDAKALEQTRAADEAKAAEQARAAAARAAEEAQRQAQAKAAAAKQASEAKQAAEAKRVVDEHARQEREAELRRQLAEEEHVDAVEASPLRDRYIASLRNRIQNAWIKPPSARVGIDCRVAVTQVPGGEVTSARVTKCNGDAAVRQSIENAVYRASPLPDPPDPALFQRNFEIEFKPDE